MINEEITIKHLDILLKNIVDVTQFDINSILLTNSDFSPFKENQKNDFTRVCQSVKRMGETFKYFKSEINRPKVFGLTKEGIKAKELGGHLKYQNSLTEKPLDWYRLIPIILTVIFGSLTIYFAKLNYDLKMNQSDVKKENDSLIIQNAYLLKLVDSLTNENNLNIYKLDLTNSKQKESTKTD